MGKLCRSGDPCSWFGYTGRGKRGEKGTGGIPRGWLCPPKCGLLAPSSGCWPPFPPPPPCFSVTTSTSGPRVLFGDRHVATPLGMWGGILCPPVKEMGMVSLMPPCCHMDDVTKLLALLGVPSCLGRGQGAMWDTQVWGFGVKGGSEDNQGG